MRTTAARLALLLLVALAGPAVAAGSSTPTHDGTSRAVAVGTSLRDDVVATLALPARADQLAGAVRTPHGEDRVGAVVAALGALLLAATWWRRRVLAPSHAPACRTLPAAGRAPPAYA